MAEAMPLSTTMLSATYEAVPLSRMGLSAISKSVLLPKGTDSPRYWTFTGIVTEAAVPPFAAVTFTA
jgi:hypothetical protein